MDYSLHRLSKTSMIPPGTSHTVRDSVRNSVLQVRNYTDDEYAQQPPPPFQHERDFDVDDDDDVVEDMNLEIDTTHASVAGAQNGFVSGNVPQNADFYDDGQRYGQRDTYAEEPQDIRTPYANDYSAMDPEIHQKNKRKKWTGRIGGMFKGVKRIFGRGRRTETASHRGDGGVSLGDHQHGAIPSIRVHSEHPSQQHNLDSARPYSRASASYPAPQRPGLGVVKNNETTFYSSADTTTDPGGPVPQSQPVTMMYIDPELTEERGGARSTFRQSFAPPTRQASLKHDDEENRGPDDIHRSTSHVSHRSHLSDRDPLTAQNAQMTGSFVPSSYVPGMPISMPYIASAPPVPPPSAVRKDTISSRSRHTSHSRSYFSSEISSPVGHLLHLHRLIRDLRQMPWLASGGRITSGYVPKFSSPRAKERMSRSRRVQAEMERIAAGSGPSWYTPSPKQRAKMEKRQRRRDKYLKHHDHDHDAPPPRAGKGRETGGRLRSNDYRRRHVNSNSTSPGHSTPSRRHSSTKARRNRISFKNGFPYYIPPSSSQNPLFGYPYPYGAQAMYMIPSPPGAFQVMPPSSVQPSAAAGRPGMATAGAGVTLAPPQNSEKGRLSRPASVMSRMTATQENSNSRRPVRELPVPPQAHPQAQAVYMIPTFISPPGSPTPSGQTAMPFPQPMPFPYPPSAWTGVPQPQQPISSNI